MQRLVVNVVTRKQVRQVGAELTDGLTELQKKFPNKISNARGAGTMQAVDARDPKLLAKLIQKLREAGKQQIGFSWFSFVTIPLFSGVLVGSCGDRTMRLRTTFIFKTHHAEIFLDRCEVVLGRLK